jgi:hypothetical protein
MMPARLLRLEVGRIGAERVTQRVEVAHGPLATLVRLASEVDEDERLAMSIDCLGTAKRLVWEDIAALRQEPTFPIDI